MNKAAEVLEEIKEANSYKARVDKAMKKDALSRLQETTSFSTGENNE